MDNLIKVGFGKSYWIQATPDISPKTGKYMWRLRIYEDEDLQQLVKTPPIFIENKFWLNNTVFRRLYKLFSNHLSSYLDTNSPDPAKKKKASKRLNADLVDFFTNVETHYDEMIGVGNYSEDVMIKRNIHNIIAFLADFNKCSDDDIRAEIFDKKKYDSPEEALKTLVFLRPRSKPKLIFKDRYRGIIEKHKKLYANDNGYDPFLHELKFAMGVVVSQPIGIDPKWALLIGPSRSGKSTHINMFEGLHRIFTYSNDMMTTNALMSGLSEVESFLKFLDGKTQMMDEMGTFLSMRKDQVAKLLGEYSVVYKGSGTKISGSEKGEETVYSRFNWLAGITEKKFQKLHDVFTTVGSRFICREYPRYDDEYYIDLAKRKAGVFKKYMKELKRAVASYCYAVIRWLRNGNEKAITDIHIPPAIQDKIDTMSKFYVLFKDREVPMWYNQMLQDLTRTMAFIDARRQVNEEDVYILITSTYASLTTWKQRLVKAFSVTRSMTLSEIKKVLRAARASDVKRWIYPFVAGGFLQDTGKEFVTEDCWDSVLDDIANFLSFTNQTRMYDPYGAEIEDDDIFPDNVVISGETADTAEDD